MDYPIKTASQLRPILIGFRKQAGLTQAALAERLGITQQSYAAFEANPEAASVERLFRVLGQFRVAMTLSSGANGSNETATVAPKQTARKRAATPTSTSTQKTTRTPAATPKKRAATKPAGKREIW